MPTPTLSSPNQTHPNPPELGPSIVFFTGGTALKELSSALCAHTHNAVHLLTPFDSGGSSATLRMAFGIPAVGDIRNRLLALAHPDFVPAEVLRLCSQRLPSVDREHPKETLLQYIYELASKNHVRWQNMPRIFAENLRLHLGYFLEKMPRHFDPSNACMGNLVLAGGYLHNRRQWLPTLALFARLFYIRGNLMPTCTKSLHLVAELEDKKLIWGQHAITKNPLPKPIHRLFFVSHASLFGSASKTQKNMENFMAPMEYTEILPHLQPHAITAIRAADAICYPMGSFYTSVLANVLLKGTGKAIAATSCPKVYIPNMGHDKEQYGLSVADAVAVLLKVLRKDAGSVPTQKLLHTVLIDTERGHYPYGIDMEGLTAQGVTVCSRPLANQKSAPTIRHDAELTAQALMRIVSIT